MTQGKCGLFWLEDDGFHVVILEGSGKNVVTAEYHSPTARGLCEAAGVTLDEAYKVKSLCMSAARTSDRQRRMYERSP